MKLCFWCDSRINFKAHLNWISVGARKCSSHFFFLLVPSIQFGIMVSGPCCTRWSASFVVDIFFYFCKIYTQISLRVCWMFSVCIRFFFRRLIFRKTLWTVFFETFSSVIFCLFFFHSKIYIKEWTVKRGWIEDDLLHRIDLSGFYGPDFFSRKHHKQWLCMANLKRIKLYKSSFNPLYRNSESNRWTDNKFSL